MTANRIIQEYLAPRFREGDYAGGISAATATLTGAGKASPSIKPASVAVAALMPPA
ncbi:TPM domain-containing protein [Xanthomonas hortorum]|uniref:TPM domain-containing protein n=1 Tax=Xanthomonas hortorum TaxID=56454 RepID=UPI003F6867D2